MRQAIYNEQGEFWLVTVLEDKSTEDRVAYLLRADEQLNGGGSMGIEPGTVLQPWVKRGMHVGWGLYELEDGAFPEWVRQCCALEHDWGWASPVVARFTPGQPVQWEGALPAKCVPPPPREGPPEPSEHAEDASADGDGEAGEHAGADLRALVMAWRRALPEQREPTRAAVARVRTLEAALVVYLYDLLFAALRGARPRLRLDTATAAMLLEHAMGLAAHNRDLPAYQADPARACLSAGTEHHLHRVVQGLVHMLSTDDRFPGDFGGMAPDGVRPIVLALVNERMTALGRCNKARWEAWRREDETRGKAGEVYSPEDRARLRAERGDVWGNEARMGFIVECVGLLHPARLVLSVLG